MMIKNYVSQSLGHKDNQFLYARQKKWPSSSVRPSTIACERDILKTACGIDFTF